MGLLRSLAMAFSCFSRIPVPHVSWEESNMRYMMAFFPFVGAVVGAMIVLWEVVVQVTGFGSVLRAVGFAIIPLAVTGGIHLDGFADVVDALSSHAEPERKRQILKDPHVGAFAVIGVAAYLLAYFGLATEVPVRWRAIAILACVHVLVRCESGIATVVFKGSGEAGSMLASFRDSARRGSLVMLIVEYLGVAALMVVLSPAVGGITLAIGALAFALLHPFAKRSFGGMSGDIAGFFLQVCEIAMLASLVVAAKAVGL